MRIDYPKLFNIVDKITTLPIIRKGNNWYGKCYINGKPAHRFDKTVITLLPKNIRILENGGEVMSIAQWLVSYGGCSSYSEAYKKLRNEESGVINTTFVIEEEKPIRYISQEETSSRRFPLACCQISELNCSKAPLNRRSSTTILSNICLIATPILAPNLPISGNTAGYPAAGS